MDGPEINRNLGSSKILINQGLVRKISNPLDTNDQDYKTNFGSTGILVNGVEVLNYKSKDSIYYGSLESISPISSGSGYDIITPPVLQIPDAIGSGATAHCSVKGSLERIDIVYAGFDYLNESMISKGLKPFNLSNELVFRLIRIRIWFDVRISSTMHMLHSTKNFFCMRRVIPASTFDNAVDEAIVQNRIWRHIVKLFNSLNDLFRT